MKPRKHRIFIVGSGLQRAKQVKDKLLRKLQNAKQQGDSPIRERVSSKRKHLFQAVQQVVKEKDRDKGYNKQKYQYNIGHIHAEPIGTILNCELIGNSQQKQEKIQQRLKGGHKPQLKNAKPIEVQPLKLQESNNHNQVNNNLIKQSPHNDTFTCSPRVKIFQGINLGEFRPNKQLSSLSNIKRRSIFFRHQSLEPISLNTSISKQRRRIFSTDCKSHPILPIAELLPHHKIAPLQSTIKEQEEIIKMTEVVQEAKMKQTFNNYA